MNCFRVQRWPTTVMVFLGIMIDMVRGELHFLEDKLHRLEESLKEWGDWMVCSRKELESLIGHSNHACKVVRAGRSFLHRMVDLLHERSNQHAVTSSGPVCILLILSVHV